VGKRARAFVDPFCGYHLREPLVATPHIRTSYLTDEGVWRIDIDGMYDVTAAGRLAGVLARLAAASRPVVVDLSRTRFADGSLIQTLKSARALLDESGSSLRVVLAPSRTNHDLLRLPTGLLEYSSFEEAIASLRAPASRRYRWAARPRRVG
jgi:anti-anti-sigma regulatory factor